MLAMTAVSAAAACLFWFSGGCFLPPARKVGSGAYRTLTGSTLSVLRRTIGGLGVRPVSFMSARRPCGPLVLERGWDCSRRVWRAPRRCVDRRRGSGSTRCALRPATCHRHVARRTRVGSHPPTFRQDNRHVRAPHFGGLRVGLLAARLARAPSMRRPALRFGLDALRASTGDMPPACRSSNPRGFSPTRIRQKQRALAGPLFLAERVGFEPTVR